MRIIRKLVVKMMYDTKHLIKLQDFFRDHANESFTAKDLCDIFKDSMNQATIYRKLISLESSKRIRKIVRADKETYEYQYQDKTCENHLHLICEKCGKMIHLDCSLSQTFLEHLSNIHHFSIDQQHSNLLGICKECQSNG